MNNKPACTGRGRPENLGSDTASAAAFQHNVVRNLICRQARYPYIATTGTCLDGPGPHAGALNGIHSKLCTSPCEGGLFSQRSF